MKLWLTYNVAHPAKRWFSCKRRDGSFSLRLGALCFSVKRG